MFVREAIKTRTPEPVFTFNDETQRDRKLSKRLLIRLNCGQSRDQIALAVRRAASVELPVADRRRKRPGTPVSQMAHGLHVVVTVNHEGLWSTAALAVDDGIPAA